MSEIIEGIRNTSLTRWILQLVSICVGIIGSVILVVLGYLQEGTFEILVAPVRGIVNQIQILLLTKIGPTIILLMGGIGFVSLILIPGVILSQLLYSDINGFTRLLIGTALSLLIMFFPISYGLLFGIPPNWLLILLPSVLAIFASVFKVELVIDVYEEFKSVLRWFREDFAKRKHLWFWLTLAFIFLVRFSLFSYTDSYWTDSVTYVGYAEAIANGTLLTGHEIVQPIGFPLFTYPFVWLAGDVPWGLSLGNWILTVVALLGFVPILQRIYHVWPTKRKPPLRLFLLVFISFPWNTILMSSIFHEASLLFITALAAETIGSKLKWSEMWLGLAIGIGYLIRPTHALMYFTFMLIPLYENRQSISSFFLTGIRSFVVALPVIPLLVRNLVIEGSIFAEYDLQFFSLSNIPDSLWWLASFITHSDEGVFTLLFAIPLLFGAIMIIRHISELNAETSVWILLSIVSSGVFILYPTDQPRLYSYFFWLIPIILLMGCWEKRWEVTCILFVIWQILVFSAIPFSPQGWIIDGASSYLVRIAGIVKPLPGAAVFLTYFGVICLLAGWLALVLIYKRYSEDEVEKRTKKF